MYNYSSNYSNELLCAWPMYLRGCLPSACGTYRPDELRKIALEQVNQSRKKASNQFNQLATGDKLSTWYSAASTDTCLK